jgi:tetratricopeptide (TPR) repeat protein
MLNNSDEIEKLFDRAWNDFSNQNYSKSKQICDQIVELNNCHPKAYYLKGLIYFEEGKDEESIENFNKALDCDRDKTLSGKINYQIGKLYDVGYGILEENSFHNPEKAKNYYLNAKHYDTYPADVILRLAAKSNDIQEKITLYKEGIEKFPQNPICYLKLANIYERELQDISTQNKVLHKAYEQVKNLPSVTYSLGVFHYNNAEYSKAREFFVETIELCKKSNLNTSPLFFALANTYYMEDNYNKALDNYQVSISSAEIRSEYLHAFLSTLNVCSKIGKIDILLNPLKKITIDEWIFDFQFGEIIFYLDLHDPFGVPVIFEIEETLKNLKILKNTNKDIDISKKIYALKSIFFRELEKEYDRIMYLRKYLNYDQSDYVLNELASAYVGYLSYTITNNNSIEHYTKSFTSDIKEYPRLMNFISKHRIRPIIQQMFEEEHYKETIKIFESLSEEIINDADCWFKIAYSYDELEYFDKAERAYEKNLYINPDCSSSLYNLSLIKRNKGHLEESYKLISSALNLEPEDELYKKNRDMIIEKLNELKQKERSYKSAIASLETENDFSMDRLKTFIIKAKRDPEFSEGKIPIPHWKFPQLMETKKEYANSLKERWLERNYIRKTNDRSQHGANIFEINPLLEKELDRIIAYQLDKNWINSFTAIDTLKLEEVGYFDVLERIKNSNNKYIDLFERDYKELVLNHLMNNRKATIILAGSLIELILIYYCEAEGFESIAFQLPKGKTVTKKIYDCVLSDLINYFEQNKILGQDFSYLSNLSRIYRNFIHPGKELREKQNLDKIKADLCYSSCIEIIRKVLK